MADLEFLSSDEEDNVPVSVPTIGDDDDSNQMNDNDNANDEEEEEEDTEDESDDEFGKDFEFGGLLVSLLLQCNAMQCYQPS